MKKILIASDTASNHYGGVNLRMPQLVEALRAKGHSVAFINADLFKGFYLPFAKAIKIPLLHYKTIAGLISEFNPDYIHIETEGPIGNYTKRYCLKKNYPYTTAYSSRYDHHLYDRIRLPKALTNRFLYDFHKKSQRILVRTQSMKEWLHAQKLTQATVVSAGVKKEYFYCYDDTKPIAQVRPKCIYAGRVEKEKNLEAFLNLDADIEKIIVGDGSLLEKFKRRYPEVTFAGYVKQQDLHHWYNKADIFVFPSKSETLGNVLMEAMSCGLPVAALPVCGPIDVVKPGVSGFLGDDLSQCIEQCKRLSRRQVVDYAKCFTTADVAQNFLDTIVPVHTVHPK